MEQIPTGDSFTFSGVNQPCGATTVLHIPPVYNFVNQEVCQPTELQPGGSVNDVHGVLISPDDSGYCVQLLLCYSFCIRGRRPQKKQVRKNSGGKYMSTFTQVLFLSTVYRYLCLTFVFLLHCVSEGQTALFITIPLFKTFRNFAN